MENNNSAYRTLIYSYRRSIELLRIVDEELYNEIINAVKYYGDKQFNKFLKEVHDVCEGITEKSGEIKIKAREDGLFKVQEMSFEYKDSKDMEYSITTQKPFKGTSTKKVIIHPMEKTNDEVEEYTDTLFLTVLSEEKNSFQPVVKYYSLGKNINGLVILKTEMGSETKASYTTIDRIPPVYYTKNEDFGDYEEGEEPASE